MSKKKLVLDAFDNKKVERVPVGFWFHFVNENEFYEGLNNDNVIINIIKATSLAFLMSVQEITAIAKIEAAYGYNYTEAYLVIFVVYIILCSIIQLLFSLAEKNIGKYRDTNTNHKPLNHVVFMDNGIIIEEGNPYDFFNNPQQERSKQFLRRLSNDYEYNI